MIKLKLQNTQSVNLTTNPFIPPHQTTLARAKSLKVTSSTSLKKNKLVKIQTIENSVDIFTFDSFSRIHEETVYRCCEQYN